jgi:hypothetical protein
LSKAFLYHNIFLHFSFSNFNFLFSQRLHYLFYQTWIDSVHDIDKKLSIWDLLLTIIRQKLCNFGIIFDFFIKNFGFNFRVLRNSNGSIDFSNVNQFLFPWKNLSAKCRSKISVRWEIQALFLNKELSHSFLTACNFL